MAVFVRHRRGRVLPATHTVTVTGNGSSAYCYIEMGGEKFTGAGVYVVTAGTVITAGVRKGISDSSNAVILMDGEQVASSISSATLRTWSFPVHGDVEITLKYGGKTSVSIVSL